MADRYEVRSRGEEFVIVDTQYRDGYAIGDPLDTARKARIRCGEINRNYEKIVEGTA